MKRIRYSTWLLSRFANCLKLVKEHSEVSYACRTGQSSLLL